MDSTQVYSSPVPTSLCSSQSEAVNGSDCANDVLSSNIAPFNQLALRVTYIVIGCIGLLGNLLVVLVIFNYTSMKKKLTNTFIINQSLIDSVASLFILAQGIFEVDGNNLTAGNIADELLCCLWLTRAPLWSMLMSSTYNLVALTLERYFEIVHPIAHKMKFSKNKAVAGMGVVWLIGPAYNLAYEVPTSKIIDGVCYPFSIWPSDLAQTSVGVLTILLQYILPIAIMSFCYIRIAMAVGMRIHPPNQVAGANADVGNRYERARRNIIKTLIIVCICFSLCWTWNEIFIFMYFVGYPTDFSSPFYHFTVVAVFVNSCVNPIIYIFKYEDFQKGLKKFLCQRCKKYNSDVMNNSTATSASVNVINVSAAVNISDMPSEDTETRHQLPQSK